MSELIQEPTDDEFSRMMDERAPSRLKTTDTLPENEPQPQQEAAPVEQAQETQLPDKFQGKSAEDIARAYTELEQRMGQMSQELGSYRGMQNELEQMRAALSEMNSPQPEPVPQSADWLDDGMVNRPTETLQWIEKNQPQLYDRALEAWSQYDPFAAGRYDTRRELQRQHEEIRNQLASVAAPVAQVTQEKQLAEAYGTILQKIPDYASVADEVPAIVANDPYLRDALQQGDVQAKARILENLYYTALGQKAARGETPQQVAQTEEQQAKTAAQQAKKAAAVVTGSNAGERGGQTPSDDMKSRLLSADAGTNIHAELARNRAAAKGR